MGEKNKFASTMSTLWAKATALITGWRKWDSPNILFWILMVIAILGFLWFARHVPRLTNTPKAPQEAGAAAYPTFLPPPTEQASDLKLYIYELMHSALGKVEEQKRAAVEEHRDALTRFSDLTFWYAAFITALSAFFLMTLLGTIWKTGRDLKRVRDEADKQLGDVQDKVDTATLLVQYSYITNHYYRKKQALAPGSGGDKEKSEALAKPRAQEGDLTKEFSRFAACVNTVTEKSTGAPGRWGNHADLLRTTIWDILQDNTEDSLKTGEELYKLFHQLPKREEHAEEQALSQAYFVRFFAQQKKFNEAREKFGALKASFGKQHGAIARARAYLASAYARTKDFVQTEELYRKIKQENSNAQVAAVQAMCARILISHYGENGDISTAEALFEDVNILGQLGKKLIQKERARASVNMISVYADTLGKDSLTKARAVFEAMKDLGDTEVIREERAKASFNMIIGYGKADKPEEARAVFDAMKDLGDTEAIRELRAEASVNMISAYGDAGKLEEARAVFDTIEALGDTDALRELRARASVRMILAYSKAGKPEEARAVFETMEAMDGEWRAISSVSMILAYGKANEPEEARIVFEAMKELGDTEAVQKWRAIASGSMILAYGKAGKPEEARAVLDAMKTLGDTEAIRERRAEASRNMILAYGKAGKPEEARAVFDAMKELGDTEAIREERARASGDIISVYGDAGKPEEARAVFDAMRDLGDTEAIREERARGSRNMIVVYGNANKPEEARAVFDAMEELGDFPGRQELLAQAGASLIIAYTLAKRPKKRDKEAALAVYNAIKDIVVEGEALEWRQKAEEALRKKGWL